MKRFLSMLIAFALVLSFTACGNSEPVKDNDSGKTSSGNGNLLGGDEEKEPAKEPEEINSDYADLMNTLVWAEAICGVAYVGYVEGPSGDGYGAIIEESGLMEYYSFVAEIPSERFVETDGYDMYCVVPASLDYSVKVEEVSLPENTEAWEPIIGETIYESETGEPILLKCNESDIFTNVLVTITTPDGTEKKISPYLSLMDGSLAGINEDQSGLTALDFTRYEINLDDFCTFDELVGSEWTSYYYYDDETTYIMNLSFFYNDYGQQCVEFWYGLENSDIDEIFTGTVYENYDDEGNWDGGYTLDMSLTGGL
jgi:predicted small lipoprotein YifL